MSSQQNLKTVSGYVIALPKQPGAENCTAKIALREDDGTEYHIMPKGLGMDLIEHINAGVELTGAIEIKDETPYILVRQYKVQDEYDDSWYDDDD